MKKQDPQKRIALLKEVILELMDRLDGDAFILSAEGPRFTGKMKPLVRVLGKDSTAEWARRARDGRDLGHAALDGLLKLNKKGMIDRASQTRAFEMIRYARDNRG